MRRDRSRRVVADVPDPPEVDTQVLREVVKEALAWSEAFVAQTASMEEMTPDDLKVRTK